MIPISKYYNEFSSRIEPRVPNVERATEKYPIVMRSVEARAKPITIGNVTTKYLGLKTLAKCLQVSATAANKWYRDGILPDPLMEIPVKANGKSLMMPVYTIDQIRLLVAFMNAVYCNNYVRISLIAHEKAILRLHELSEQALYRFRKRLESKNGTRSLNAVPIRWGKMAHAK